MMTRNAFLSRLACGLFFLVAALAPPSAAAWRREVLVPGMAGAGPDATPHGLTGLSFGPDGAIYAGSVAGPGVFRFDLAAGTVSSMATGLMGEADDVAVAADGTLAWTAVIAGEIRILRPNQTPRVLATGLANINPIAFDASGKIFAGQGGRPDALIEVDPATGAVREIARALGGINAFAPDGKGGLWVPLAEKGAIGRVDLTTGALAVIADGLGQPVAVKPNSKGDLFAIDWLTGHVFHISPVSGEASRIATVAPPLDNIAVGPDDTLYVTRPVDNALIALDPSTGAQRILFRSALAGPGGLAIVPTGPAPGALLVADVYGTRTVDLASHAVTAAPYDQAVHSGSMITANDRTLALTNARRGTLVISDRKTSRVRHSLGGFKAPMGVLIESDDSLLVIDHGSGEIIRVRPGQKPERATVFAGLEGPVGLVAAPNGRYYVTEAGAGRLVDIDPATGDRRIISGRLNQPEGLAVMPDGRIAVAEVGARRLLIVGAGSGRIEEVATDLPIGAPFTRAPSPVFLPTGVAADGTGALFLSCDRDNTILKFSPE